MSDLISRSAVIELLYTYHIDNIAVNGKRITELIKEIPPVEPARGEWENVSDDEKDLCFRCTNCKSEFSCEIDMRQFAKHCPECGADMQKKVE